MKVPVSEPSLTGSELRMVVECVRDGWLTMGSRVEEFEGKFARFCGTKYAVAVMNGTAALHTALMAFGVGPGDEVIVPTLTFISTANAVKYCGATPVFCDIEPDTWCIDPKCAELLVTSRTKGIIPVHLYGHPADMEPIMRVASKHNLFVLEDAAEAHGAKYKGKVVGSIGHAAAFSFYANKIVTTGEGGMITTNDSARRSSGKQGVP